MRSLADRSCKRHASYHLGMPLPPPLRPDWDRIATVLLDLDGTLLDLAFDNYFWLEYLPEVYAAARSLSVEEAKAALVPIFRAHEGTLNWYCIEHWSRELSLDIPSLKRGVAARVAWIPGAQDFLTSVRHRGKRLVLLTNAHPETLRIKDDQTGVCGYFDRVFSSHEFGAPKESAEFWKGLRRVEPFDSERTMFVDDSPAVLRAARAAGIRWIYAIRRPDSSREAREHPELAAVDRVRDLL